MDEIAVLKERLAAAEQRIAMLENATRMVELHPAIPHDLASFLVKLGYQPAKADPSTPAPRSAQV